MSSAAAGASGSGGGRGDRPTGDRRQSLTKFMNRAKSALKRDKTKRSSTDSPAQSPTTSPPALEGVPLVLPVNEPITLSPTTVEQEEQVQQPAGVSAPTKAPAAPKAPETTEDPETRRAPIATEKAAQKPAERVPEAKVPEAKPVAAVASASTPAATEAKPRPVVIPMATILEERARALFEKYGLTLEPHELATSNATTSVERVYKPIRMRVHRQCHRCQASFGVEKTCTQCGHRRCKKCPRYPVKKLKTAQDKGKGRAKEGVTAGGGFAAAAGSSLAAAAAGITLVEAGASRAKPRGRPRLTIPAKTQTQDRVYMDIKQRVHRTCHRCERQFGRGEKTCNHCGHVRCTRCPRDPPKLHKYPHGYPGDAEAETEGEEGALPGLAMKERVYKKTRMVVRWYCHECQTLFIRRSRQCASCSHERCQDCKRVPQKKVKPPPDPEVLRSVEAKLAAMSLSSGRGVGRSATEGG